jgi:RNA methyltransferase, TrmH family
MPIITSREHPAIKQLIKLEKSAPFRKKNGLTLLDGTHLIQTYYAVFGAPTSLVVNQSRSDHHEIKRLLALISRQEKTKIYHVSDALFRHVSPVKTPTGILATIPIPTAQTIPLNQDNSFCVLLEAIQDPGNLGSILRSAAAANVSDIYLSSDCADTWSPKTLRAAMGAHFFLRIHERSNLLEIIQQFNGKVIATSLRAEKNLYQISLTGPIAFIFGNEGNGVSEAISQAAEEKITIPMPGKTESLNAAAAAAICFFEKVRQESLIHTE